MAYIYCVYVFVQVFMHIFGVFVSNDAHLKKKKKALTIIDPI